jgi:hypothetical protein
MDERRGRRKRSKGPTNGRMDEHDKEKKKKEKKEEERKKRKRKNFV